MKTFDIQIKTPLWTGGIDRQCDRIHETGFIGSLRWWYEAILRGFGHRVCDPGTHSCSNDAGLCKACELFGATGSRRKFRLIMNGGTDVFPPQERINIRPKNRNRGWFYQSGLVGDITLKVISFDTGVDLFNQLETVLLLASKWGGLGAKTQHGYGVLAIKNQLQPDLSCLPTIPNTNPFNLPDLRHFFFSKVQFDVTNEVWWELVDGFQDLNNGEWNNLLDWVNSGSVPIAPAVKNLLRYGETIETEDGRTIDVSILDTIDSRNANNELFGYTNPNDDRKASHINISCAYPISEERWQFRIWGWIPESNLYDREQVLDSLKQEMRVILNWEYALGQEITNISFCWREFNSDRDTKGRITDQKTYLNSLLS